MISSDNGFIAKYNTYGAVVWQKEFDYGGSNAKAIAVDGDGNVYATGYTYSSGAGNVDVFIVKYSSIGAVVWQRTFGGTDEDIGNGIAVDGAGNVYITGYTASSGVGFVDVFIVKYNSSGGVVWQRTLGAENYDEGVDIAVDGDGNVYVAGYSNSYTTGTLVAKYSSGGTLSWQNNFIAMSAYGCGMSVDSSNNVYVAARIDLSSSEISDYSIAIIKYDTDGVPVWQRTISRTGTDETATGMSIDSSNNVYIIGYTSSVGGNDVFIAKYTSGGGLSWQRTLGTAGDDKARGIAVDSSGNVYIAGTTGTKLFIAKLPTDGTLTGTYGTYTYASSTFNQDSPTATSESLSLESQTPSTAVLQTGLTPSLSSVDSAFIFTTIPVP